MIELGQLLLINNKVQLRLIKKSKMTTKKLQKYKLTLDKIKLKAEDVIMNIENQNKFEQELIKEL